MDYYENLSPTKQRRLIRVLSKALKLKQLENTIDGEQIAFRDTGENLFYINYDGVPKIQGQLKPRGRTEWSRWNAPKMVKTRVEFVHGSYDDGCKLAKEVCPYDETLCKLQEETCPVLDP